MVGRGDGILDGLLILHVDDLNEFDPWKLPSNLIVSGAGEMIAKLQRVRAASTLLINDFVRLDFAGE